MKKISLKTFRKSFNLSKSKEDAEFMVVQQPALAGDFGKEESLFGSCYGKEMAGCELHGEDEKGGGKNRAKSESLMGTLKRRLSAKQKAKGKGGAAAGGAADEDTFSSSSAPLVFKDARAPRPMRSTSLRSHHYSPTPWPLRPTASEETCIRMEVRVKALVHSPGTGPALNGVRKDFGELRPAAEPACPCPEPLAVPGSPAPVAGDLRLRLGEHVPVVLGLLPQDYLPYTVPLDGSSPMEVSAVPPPPAAGGPCPARRDEDAGRPAPRVPLLQCISPPGGFQAMLTPWCGSCEALGVTLILAPGFPLFRATPIMSQKRKLPPPYRKHMPSIQG